MSDQTTVDRLRTILNKRLTDDQIIGGVRLSDSGMQKVAAVLGVAASDIPTLFNSLKTKIRRENADHETKALAEDGERFAIEPDLMGNVTIRDTVSGHEVVLRGAEAAEARAEYKRHGAAALRHFIPVTESVLREFQQPDDQSFDEEIAATAHGGTFNFPWRADGQHGFGTARFDRTGQVTRILYVSDGRGEEMQPTPEMLAKIKQAAQNFIGRE